MAESIAGLITVSGRNNVATLLVLQPIAVDTGSPDRVGRLVLANGLLVAVLVQLNAADYDQGGGWFLEAGFGRLQGVIVPTFDTLEDATRWLRGRLDQRE